MVRISRRHLLAGAAVVGLSRPALAQAKTLEVWSFSSPTDTDVVGKAVANVVETFKAAHPGIELKITSMPWMQLSPTLMRAAHARRGPDVAMLYSPDMPVQIAAGALMPLSDRMAAWSDDQRRDMLRLPQAEDAKGTIYGLPWQVRTSGLLYRADLLDKARSQPPKTLAEWSDEAASLQGGDMVGIALGFNPTGASIAGGWFLVSQLGTGADVLTADGHADFATPQAEKLVQWLVDQVKTRKTLPLDVAMLDQEKEHDLFSARRAVFLPTSSDRLAREIALSGLPADALAMTRYPTFDPGVTAPALVQSWNLVMPSGAKQPDLAWQFIEHWTSDPVQVAQAKIAGMGPCRRSALSDPYFNQPQARVLRWATEYASDQPMRFKFPVNTSTLYDTWVRMFAKVLNNESSIKDGLAWANADFNQRLPRLTASAMSEVAIARPARLRLMTRSRMREEVSAAWLFYPAFALVACVSFFPLFYAIRQSLHRADYLNLGPYVGLQNYVALFRTGGGEWLLTASLLFVGGTLALTLPIGIGLALLLARPIRFRAAFQTILTFPWVVSELVTGYLWMWLYDGRLGPLGPLLATFRGGVASLLADPHTAMAAMVVANTWHSFPLVMILTLAALQTVPAEVQEAARLDTRSEWQRFRFVTFPLIRNTVLVVAVLTTLHTFNNVTLVLAMTGGGPAGATEVLGIRAFNEAFQFYRMDAASAVAVVIFTINIVASVFYMRVLRGSEE